MSVKAGPMDRGRPLPSDNPQGLTPMTELHLIRGGRDASDTDKTAALAAIPFLPLMDRAAATQFAMRTEAGATSAIEQITAAVAVLAKGKGELVSLMAAAGREQAVEGHAALRRALAGAVVLVDVLRAAETRFAIARAAAGHPEYFR
jgi:hypothetical protein